MISRVRRTATERVDVVRVRGGERRSDADQVAVEEPLEIRLEWEGPEGRNRTNIAVTMRTPGDDFELAAGFLFGEGIVGGRDEIADIAYCLDASPEQEFNVVTVTLRVGVAFDPTVLQRNFYATSSCGVCGKASIEAIEHRGCRTVASGFKVGEAVLRALPATLREAQSAFEVTGGLHAAGLFDGRGRLLAAKEDVGRHNAVDKVIGEQLMAGALPLAERVLALSGRASFELVQKAVAAGIPVVVAVGAPSSLAVRTAAAFGVTLAGFVRGDGFNVYAGGMRITG